jgi:hypothetical protein
MLQIRLDQGYQQMARIIRVLLKELQEELEMVAFRHGSF